MPGPNTPTIKHLIFDTETSGRPKNYKATYLNTRNWPRVVQLAWELCDDDGGVLESGDWLIKMTDTIISPGATRIHGITMAMSLKDGKPINDALDAFQQSLEQADVLVAHNMKFDYNVLGAEYYRYLRENPLEDVDHYCTMDNGTDFCALPGKYGNKWPTLAELHGKLFGKSFEGAHDAAVDVSVTRRCYFALLERGLG